MFPLLIREEKLLLCQCCLSVRSGKKIGGKGETWHFGVVRMIGKPVHDSETSALKKLLKLSVILFVVCESVLSPCAIEDH